MSFLIVLKDYLQIIKINYLDNMAIIRYTKDATIRYAYLNIFPDQFKTDKEKENEGWIILLTKRMQNILKIEIHS